MNLTWHIVKKDLRALRWPLGLWLLVIVAKLGVGVALLTADGSLGKDWFLRMDALSKILSGLECVLFVLVAAIIQEDSLVGTTAFWMTRPISGARLLRAKLAAIALVFLVAPVMVTLPWWLGCGYGMREIAWAATETLAIHAIFVLLGLLWAVVTDGFARFLMWTLVTLFVVPTLTATLMYYTTGRGQHGPTGDVMATRVAIELALAAIGVIVVAVHQFLTRHTWRSIAIISAMAGLIVLVGISAPWSWQLERRAYTQLVRLADEAWKSDAEPAGLKYTVETAKLGGPRRQNNSAARRELTGAFRVEGIAITEALQAGPSQHSWVWPDGTTEKGFTWTKSHAENMIAQKALGLMKEAAGDGRYTDTMETRATVSQEIGEKLLTTTPAYTLKVRFRLLKIDTTTMVLPQSGPRDLRGALSERIASVEKDGEELLVTVVRSNPSLWVDNAAGQPYPAGQFGQYLLVNRARDFVDRGRQVDRLSTRIGTVNIFWQTMSYRASRNAGGKRPSIEAINALNDAELVKVAFSERARFTHDLTTDAFVTEPISP